jgi:hypothetical protein
MINSIEQEILKDVLNNPGDTFYENVLSDYLDEQGIEHDFRNPLHNDKITELKPYQEKCLDIWANHWTNIGLCTKPTNENKAERYFFDFYKELGLEKPKSIIWINNPVEMLGQANNQRGNCVVNNLWGKTWLQICAYISNSVYNQVWDWMCEDKLSCIMVQIWGHVAIQGFNLTDNRVWYGQHETRWLAYYAYIMQVLRLKISKTFISFMLLAQEINWWFSTEETVYVTRKPRECIVKDGKLVKLVYQDNYTIT